MNLRAQIEQSITLLNCSQGPPCLEKQLCLSTDINFTLYLVLFWREEQFLSENEHGRNKNIHGCIVSDSQKYS